MESRTWRLLTAVGLAGALLFAWLWKSQARTESRVSKVPEVVEQFSAGTESPLEVPATPERIEDGGREPVAVAAEPARSPRRRETPTKLEQDAVLLVQVLANETREPLAGISVNVTLDLATLSQESGVAETELWEKYGKPNAIGGYSITGVSQETDSEGKASCKVASGMPLQVSASPADPTELRVGSGEFTVSALAAGETREVELLIPVGGLRYHGLVTERDGRTPIADAIVATRGDWAAGNLETRTDSEGRFSLEIAEQEESDWSFDRVFAVVRADGFAVACGVFEPGHSSRHEAQLFRLWKAGAVLGRVVDERGLGLSGMSLSIGCMIEPLLQPVPELAWSYGDFDPDRDEVQTVVTDLTGEFRIDGLPPHVVLTWMATDERERECSGTVTLHPGEERVLGIVLPERVTLMGKVVDAARQAVGGVDLWLVESRESTDSGRYFGVDGLEVPLARCTSEPDGTFRFERLVPGGYYVGPAPKEPNSPYAKEAASRTPGAEEIAPFGARIELEPGVREHSIEVTLERGLHIRGRVEGPGGKPAARVSLTLQMPFLNTVTGEDGSFTTGPLASGEYFLQAFSGEHLRSEWVRASAGDQDVVLRLALGPQGVLRGRLEGARSPAAGWAELTRREDSAWSKGVEVNSKGEFTFTGLEPSRYDLVVTTHAGQWGSQSDLSPGRKGSAPIAVQVGEATYLRVSASEMEFPVLVRAIRDGLHLGSLLLQSEASDLLLVPLGSLQLEALSVDFDDLDWARHVAKGPVLSKSLTAIAGEEVEIAFP